MSVLSQGKMDPLKKEDSLPGREGFDTNFKEDHQKVTVLFLDNTYKKFIYMSTPKLRLYEEKYI